MKKNRKPIVLMKVLPGEPLDGTGQICIHLVVRDEKHGSFIEPHVLHNKKDKDGNLIRGELVAKPTRCRIACNRKLVPQTRLTNSTITILVRSDDPRATTCPKCKTSPEYEAMMNELERN